VNKILVKSILTLFLLAELAFLVNAPAALSAEKIQLDTQISFVGQRFSIDAQLPGIWTYSLGNAGDAIEIGKDSDDKNDPVRGQTITITEKEAFDYWPENHSAQWAADTYRQWELEVMKSQGVKTGMYRLRNIKMSQLDIHGKHFFTFTYEQTFDNPMFRDVRNYAYLFLHFPDSYAASHKFYWIHYLQARDKKDKAKPSLDLIQSVIAGLSLDFEDFPGETTVSWLSPDNEHVHISVPHKKRTYYFNNNDQRLCFSFSMEDIWYPSGHPGTFIATNQYDHGGIDLLSEQDLEGFKGEDIIARAVSCQMSELEESGEAKVIGSSKEDLECAFQNTIKLTTDFSLQMFGQTVQGKNPYYFSEVKPGWVAVVQAVRGDNNGDDEMARDLFDSLTFSDGPDCFSQEIAQLRN